MKLLKRLCRWICRDETWNADMSRVVDRLLIDNELQAQEIARLNKIISGGQL